jgi:RES domain-containing protein
MVKWYRAHTTNLPQKVFSGDGGLFTSGRWNHLGRKAIYCSDSIALATLEWLSHNGLSVSGFKYYRYSIEVPKELVKRFEISQLPDDWNFTPSTHSTRDFAEKYLFLKEGLLAIDVPSVMVPEERNLVINPFHSEFQKIALSIKKLGQFNGPIR